LPPKELLQGLSFLGGLRVQGKGDPLDLDSVFLRQLFSTPGTEVTPGSDVVGEDLQHQGLFHESYLQVILGVLRSGNRWCFYFGCPSMDKYRKSDGYGSKEEWVFLFLFIICAFPPSPSP
jgi:hypothetical protein